MHTPKQIQTVAVVGAGNMGSGIAQKMATEGVPVVLVDSTQERAQAGKDRIAKLLAEGVERRLFTPQQVEATLGRIRPTGELEDVSDVDLVVEAIFEDLGVKRELFAKLGTLCRPDAVLATNTSSFRVADLAGVTKHPERLIGLHYFYHPAKNRLVEVIGHEGSDPALVKAAWAFQERAGKTPIASADAPGFVVNRFFVPWLNEAVRLHEEGFSIATIEAAAKQSFGVGMGPFELMNVTGVPITLHAATTLGERFGAFYAPAKSLEPQVASKQNWALSGTPDAAAAQAVADRLWGVVYHVAMELVSEEVGSIDDTDIGARVGLRWPKGPFEHMNATGVERALALAAAVQERYGLAVPRLMQEQRASKSGFGLQLVRLDVEGGIGTITINRPDQLNALDPETVRQLGERFAEAEQRADVQAIVIAGAGKAFVAGADVKFFVDKIKAGRLDDIVGFATEGSRLYRRIEKCAKRTICRLDGMALGGGGELALACQVIVATPRASMAFPETGIGIYPGLGGTQRLTKRLGKGLARALIYSGAELSAAELEALGLAWKVVPAEELAAAIAQAVREAPVQPTAVPERFPEKWRALAQHLANASWKGVVEGKDLSSAPEAADFAKKVGRKAPLALAACERLTDMAETADLDAGLAAELEGLRAIFGSKDGLEGLAALLERRRPVYTGA